MITLYTAGTPNGRKASVALEELELPYTVRPINLGDREQKEPWYLQLNPNGRIPTIVDHDNADFAVFESGAILVYLAAKTERLSPPDDNGRSRVLQWLMFQMGGVGPMMGQASFFLHSAPERLDYAVSRYQGECRRLFEVLDTQLADHEYLAGDYSIADIANWCWVQTYERAGLSIEGLMHLQRWITSIAGRPAVQRGIQIPVKATAARDDAELKPAGCALP